MAGNRTVVWQKQWNCDSPALLPRVNYLDGERKQVKEVWLWKTDILQNSTQEMPWLWEQINILTYPGILVQGQLLQGGFILNSEIKKVKTYLTLLNRMLDISEIFLWRVVWCNWDPHYIADISLPQYHTLKSNECSTMLSKAWKQNQLLKHVEY